jgi:hypothetical protein
MGYETYVLASTLGLEFVLSVVRLGHSIYYGILYQRWIGVELENEPIESAVSSPSDCTHHG